MKDSSNMTKLYYKIYIINKLRFIIEKYISDRVLPDSKWYKNLKRTTNKSDIILPCLNGQRLLNIYNRNPVY